MSGFFWCENTVEKNAVIWYNLEYDKQMSVRVHILSKTDEGRNESFGQSLA